MDFIAKLLEKTSGLLRGVVLLSYLFIGFCSIVMANIGFDDLTGLEVSGILFFPLCIFLCRVPFVDIAILFLSLYGGYITYDKSVFAMIVFIGQCILLAPCIIFIICSLIDTLTRRKP